MACLDQLTTILCVAAIALLAIATRDQLAEADHEVMEVAGDAVPTNRDQQTQERIIAQNVKQDTIRTQLSCDSFNVADIMRKANGTWKFPVDFEGGFTQVPSPENRMITIRALERGDNYSANVSVTAGGSTQTLALKSKIGYQTVEKKKKLFGKKGEKEVSEKVGLTFPCVALSSESLTQTIVENKNEKTLTLVAWESPVGGPCAMIKMTSKRLGKEEYLLEKVVPDGRYNVSGFTQLATELNLTVAQIEDDVFEPRRSSRVKHLAPDDKGEWVEFKYRRQGLSTPSFFVSMNNLCDRQKGEPPSGASVVYYLDPKKDNAYLYTWGPR